jgi:hypothetical protein
LIPAATTLAQAPRSGNPILSGWYADPEAHVAVDTHIDSSTKFNKRMGLL